MLMFKIFSFKICIISQFYIEMFISVEYVFKLILILSLGGI